MIGFQFNFSGLRSPANLVIFHNENDIRVQIHDYRNEARSFLFFSFFSFFFFFSIKIPSSYRKWNSSLIKCKHQSSTTELKHRNSSDSNELRFNVQSRVYLIDYKFSLNKINQLELKKIRFGIWNRIPNFHRRSIISLFPSFFFFFLLLEILNCY